MSRPADDNDPIADAAFLLRDDTRPRVPPSPPAAPARDLGGYDLEGDDPPADDRPIAPPIPPPSAEIRAPRRAKVDPVETPASSPVEGPRDRVDQVWSRTAEWWPTLLIQVAVLALTAYLVKATFAVNDLATPLLVLGAGGFAFLVASYPIFITLERPVRMTPEQAAKDFYAALSHVRPHYRRMWLLLSAGGREAREFATFPEFRAYWKARVAALKGGKATPLTPLQFQVEGFQAEKSAGKTAIDGKFTVVVALESHGQVASRSSFRLQSGFVKGPDGQWYLGCGTLTEGDASS